jgi:deoxyadenosine/deoxycytidine kinase
MAHNSHFLFVNPWQEPKEEIKRTTNKYICASGNSCAGKSTIVRNLAQDIFAKDPFTIAIDEKNIHHPFLSGLFFDAKSYGFLVELNFLIQRALLVKRWLDCGYNVVMERSNLEDHIFVKNLTNSGFITGEEYNSYMSLWSSIAKKVRQPDIMIFLSTPLEKSLENIERDEKFGVRPKEFPDQQTKESWFTAWDKLYSELLEEIKQNNKTIKIIAGNPFEDLSRITKEVLENL